MRMSLFQRYRWFVAAAGITAAFAAVSLTAQKSLALAAFADLAGLVLMLAAIGIFLANATSSRGQGGSFWALMAFGFSLWACNQGAWSYQEIVLQKPTPDPYF